MPSVQTKNKVIGILSSDWHLSHRPPAARRVEGDWYKCMKRTLMELHDLSSRHNCPHIVAGDIFHKWDSTSELISFAIENMPPETYAIPGQHDLPYHSYEDRRKSAYGVLIKAGVIEDLPPNVPVRVSGNLWVVGFPWGHSPEKVSLTGFPKEALRLAVSHQFVWNGKDTGFQGAPEKSLITNLLAKFAGFDCGAFGDNHKGFLYSKRWINCGGLMLRDRSQYDYAPQVGLLKEDGTIEPYTLDCSWVKMDWTAEDHDDAEIDVEHLESLMNALKSQASKAIDFLSHVKEYCEKHNVKKSVRSIINQATES